MYGLGDDYYPFDTPEIYTAQQTNTAYNDINSTFGGNAPSGSSGYGYSTPTPNSGSLWTALTAGIFGASNILNTRYAIPQLNPGQYIQTSKQGTTMYQLAQGQTSAFPGSSLGVGGGIGGMLPMLLIGGVLLFALSKSK